MVAISFFSRWMRLREAEMSLKENLLICLAFLLGPILVMALYECVDFFVDVLREILEDL